MEIDLSESRHAYKWQCDMKKLRVTCKKKLQVMCEKEGEPYTELLPMSASLASAKVGHSQLSRAELAESEALVEALKAGHDDVPRLDATDRVLVAPSRREAA